MFQRGQEEYEETKWARQAPDEILHCSAVHPKAFFEKVGVLRVAEVVSASATKRYFVVL
jgi:hypothetical protein